MAAFRLTKRAKEDLRSIGRYTRKTWGVEQRNHYLGNLDEAFHLLATNPKRGQDFPHIRPGYRKYRVGRHLIFYREGSEGLEIIRILHDRMDIVTRLDEE